MRKVVFNAPDDTVRGETLTDDDFIGVRFLSGKRALMVYNNGVWLAVPKTDITNSYKESTLEEYVKVDRGTQLYHFNTFAELCKWVSEE